jgi:hypothetical protein
MASRVVACDTLHNAPVSLVISRAGKYIRINEFDLTIDQAMLFVGDLLDTIKATALAEVESVIYPLNQQENSASMRVGRVGQAVPVLPAGSRLPISSHLKESLGPYGKIPI